MPNQKQTYPQNARNTLTIISGLYIATLCLMNLLNITRFINFDWNLLNGAQLDFSIPVGVLPYCITFLCTDVVTECFGKQEANRLITAGLVANLWMLFVIWILGKIQAPIAPHNLSTTDPDYLFYYVRTLSIGAIISSMLAYIVAQYLDVFIFHGLKKLTQGKYLWLRNNASTMISQFIDTLLVLGGTYIFARITAGSTANLQNISLQTVIVSSYLFKVLMALIDTIPCYLLIWAIRKSIDTQPLELRELRKI